MIPLESVLKDVYLLMRESDVKEDLVMEFAIRGMEHMAVYKTYETAVCYLEVHNCQAQYPHGMYGIEAVLYRKDFDQFSEELVKTTTVKLETDDTGFLIDKDIDCKVTNFRHIFNKKSASGWAYLPLSNSVFDKSVVCDTDAQPARFGGCKDWYIPDSSNNRFITSFDEGWLCVGYHRFPQDDKGRFIIPDHPLYGEALESYVLCKLFQRLWHMSHQGAQSKYTHYLNKWQELSIAAEGELMMPSLPDYVNLDKQNKFFRDDSPLKIFGGYGKESVNLF